MAGCAMGVYPSPVGSLRMGKPKLTSKTGESLNAGGEGSSGQVVVKPGETTSVKPEAASSCSLLSETVEAVPDSIGRLAYDAYHSVLGYEWSTKE